MASKFITKENKAFLWDFLYKNGIFKNLTNAHEPRIKTIFENGIQSTGNAASGENITELNKAFITKIVQEIEILKTESNTDPPKPIIKTSMNYTHQEASAERQKLFQNNLQETQNNFNEHMKVEKPKTIDFSDKDAGDTDSNLDSKLAEIVERRKRDMNMVLSTYDTAPAKSVSDNISIGKETKLDSGNIVEVEPKKMKKSVSFDDNIASALGKNMEELFKSGASYTSVFDGEENSTYEKDVQEVSPEEKTPFTVEDFLSRLKMKPISDVDEQVVISPDCLDDKETIQTILREIVGIRETMNHILDIIKT